MTCCPTRGPRVKIDTALPEYRHTATAMSSKMSVRFSTETDNVAEYVHMHHCRFSTVVLENNKFPEPLLSPHADFDVIVGRKPWPAVDISIIEKEPTICVICGVDFKIRSNLHVHLTDHIHLMGKIDKYKKIPLYQCKLCVAEVNCSNVLRHRCFMKHQAEIADIEELINSMGSPLVCIFCRGRILPSRAHLIAHLISAHSPHRNPIRCVFCHAQFQSDSLLMQETHVFTHHVPDLIFLNRLAYFKEVKAPSGQFIDPKAPFLCLYDPRRIEDSCWIDAIPPNVGRSLRISDVAERFSRTLPSQKAGLCFARFDNLAEYTAHVYCCHAIVPHPRDLEPELNSSELKRLDAMEARIPGPTIRQLMSGHPSAGNEGTNGPKNDSLELQSTEGKATTTGFISKCTCRICLRDFDDDDGLNKHLYSFHIPEAHKRVQHLTEMGELSRVLEMDKLCTECFTKFSSVYKLQVHIMVAHGGIDWLSCGTCGQRFCESNKCLPSNLTIGGALEGNDNDNQNMNIMAAPRNPPSSPEPPSVESNTSLVDDDDAVYAPFESPLPVLTLCRMLESHEEKHCTELTPAKKIPFLPTGLITQLLESRGHQGKQVADWLADAYALPFHKDIKPFKYETPHGNKNGNGGRKSLRMEPGQDPLSPEGVEQTLRLLDMLVSRSLASLKQKDSGLDDDIKLADAAGRQKLQTLLGSGSSDISGSLSKESSSAEVPRSGSSNKMIRFFQQIGERNAAKKQEKEFAETL